MSPKKHTTASLLTSKMLHCHHKSKLSSLYYVFIIIKKLVILHCLHKSKLFLHYLQENKKFLHFQKFFFWSNWSLIRRSQGAHKALTRRSQGAHKALTRRSGGAQEGQHFVPKRFRFQQQFPLVSLMFSV